MRSDALKLACENALNISDLTRTGKLTAILVRYATNVSDEVFVAQNGRKVKGRAVIADLAYFEELLRCKEAVDAALDRMVEHTAIERQGERAAIPLARVISELDLDVARIVQLSEVVEDD